MSIGTIRDVVSWLKDFRNDRVTFTFHGGEPLLAGADFYREALPMLSDELSHLKPDFAMQTNLWLLTPELAEILAAYHVPLGTSIDGPQELNDLQRGDGYFEKTMRGYDIARSAGLQVSFICTFTNYSVTIPRGDLQFLPPKPVQAETAPCPSLVAWQESGAMGTPAGRVRGTAGLSPRQVPGQHGINRDHEHQ